MLELGSCVSFAELSCFAKTAVLVQFGIGTLLCRLDIDVVFCDVLCEQPALTVCNSATQCRRCSDLVLSS